MSVYKGGVPAYLKPISGTYKYRQFIHNYLLLLGIEKLLTFETKLFRIPETREHNGKS